MNGHHANADPHGVDVFEGVGKRATRPYGTKCCGREGSSSQTRGLSTSHRKTHLAEEFTSLLQRAEGGFVHLVSRSRNS